MTDYANTVTVERFVEFDTGHRVARHETKCRHLHGHRYKLTAAISGPIKTDDSPEHGMVIDFGRVKEALMVLHDEWDHRFILGDDDPLLAAMSGLPGLVILDRQPTAENLAEIALERLTALLAPLVVVSVTVQETTACSATVTL